MSGGCNSFGCVLNSILRALDRRGEILPALGGCVVPYRKWPRGAALFHEMICLGRSLNAKEALEVGMVGKIVDNYYDLINEAVKEVKNMAGKVKRIPEDAVAIPDISLPPVPMAGKQALSKEAVSIIVETIKAGAAADSLAAALEIGYQGFGRIVCTDAAKEGVTAFLEKRKPEFKK